MYFMVKAPKTTLKANYLINEGDKYIADELYECIV